jgi:hypothetical protein
MRKKGKPEKMKKCVKITQQAYGEEKVFSFKV